MQELQYAPAHVRRQAPVQPRQLAHRLQGRVPVHAPAAQGGALRGQELADDLVPRVPDQLQPLFRPRDIILSYLSQNQ